MAEGAQGSGYPPPRCQASSLSALGPAPAVTRARLTAGRAPRLPGPGPGPDDLDNRHVESARERKARRVGSPVFGPGDSDSRECPGRARGAPRREGARALRPHCCLARARACRGCMGAFEREGSADAPAARRRGPRRPRAEAAAPPQPPGGVRALHTAGAAAAGSPCKGRRSPCGMRVARPCSWGTLRGRTSLGPIGGYL